MLSKCPECELQVSDKAAFCPHCGYPFKPNINTIRRNPNKRKRLPNGFGQITELKGRNLRNPFRAMITVGKDAKGKPICKLLKPEAFFPTYNDAYIALLEYNRNPYDLKNDMTVQELYDRWSKEHFKNINDSTIRGITSVWQYCSSVYNIKARDLRPRHIKKCMDEGTAVIYGKPRYLSNVNKTKVKSVFNMLLDYAVEYELVDKNYARVFDVPSSVLEENKKNETHHIDFTDDEMKILWENIYKVENVDLILIQCYSGWRPQEMGLLKLENIDLDNWTFKGGMKTDSGMDRLIPIHTIIQPLVKYRYEEAVQLGSMYLFNITGGKRIKNGYMNFTYKRYAYRFEKACEQLKLNPEHKSHDARVQFVTMAKKYDLNDFAIKYIIGHAINDLTERVYTKRDIEWLRTEIEKIK